MNLTRLRTALRIVLLAGAIGWPAGAGAMEAELSPPTCGGQSLLSNLEQRQPAHFRAMLDEEQGTAHGKALLWRIDRNGTAPSFLFGTMHISDRRLTELPTPVAEALARSRNVALELSEIVDKEAFSAATMKSIGHIALGDGRSLDSLLSPDEIARLQAALGRYQIPYEAMRSMKPWFVSVAMALPLCEIARQQAGLDALDEVIGKRAVREGKKLVGLETVDEQFAAFDRLSLEDQKSMLITSVRLADALEDQIETMVQLYTSRRIGALWGFSRQLTRLYAEPGQEAADLAALERFSEHLVIARNATMAKRARPLIDRGGTFIAVGAMHLPGKGGLVDLLQQAGYRLTPMY